MSNYKKIVWVSLIYSTLKLHKKSIIYMKKHSGELTDIRERSSVIMNIGIEFLKLKEYKLASDFFVSALQMVEHKYLEFHPDFPKILKVIKENQTEEIYMKWYRNFSQRVTDDKRFKKCFMD